MVKAVVNSLRLLGIARTLAKHDALWPFEQAGVSKAALFLPRLIWGRRKTGRPGERLADALTDLGPTFIKLGQALSVRSDLVGEQIAEDLTRLQDQLPPFPYERAKATVERELGVPLSDVYSEFSEQPVAAASIAQVHRARTTEGEEVAVKILRPGVEQNFERDLTLFVWLARLTERHYPKMRRLRLIDVVETFREWVSLEMDLRLEAAAASELAENCSDEEGFRVPSVDWQRTAKRVLTIEWINGLRIDDAEGLEKAGHDTTKILENSARVFFLQVFRDGFFHADIHPGNMFVTEDGTLVPVDFGIMGRVDWRLRIFLADMLVGFLQQDYRRVSDVHFDMGVVPPYKSRDHFTQALRAIGEPLLGKPLNEISLGRLLAHLFQTTEDFDMETQPDLLLLQKTMLVAEGVGRILNPKVNMWVLAQPLIEDWMMANRGPEARLREFAGDAATWMRRLPAVLEKADRALDRLEADHTDETRKRPYGKGLAVSTRPSSGTKRATAGMVVSVLALVFATAALTLVLAG
ncbi:2-polyprenylphenol 6-hydroxylase [Aestuariispira ectoiniformans]|uniref:2-polyprenylphenol 6-hydroxylase n=1 Tax=Aestuariispira ectoiniformans TaxID=2775080 RepID=UPI00223BDDAB|nr:2-polyprenylphenol 6-hydroxylase [Aestuariispira ectoiniformans]